MKHWALPLLIILSAGISAIGTISSLITTSGTIQILSISDRIQEKVPAELLRVVNVGDILALVMDVLIVILVGVHVRRLRLKSPPVN